MQFSPHDHFHSKNKAKRSSVLQSSGQNTQPGSMRPVLKAVLSQGVFKLIYLISWERDLTTKFLVWLEWGHSLSFQLKVSHFAHKTARVLKSDSCQDGVWLQPSKKNILLGSSPWSWHWIKWINRVVSKDQDPGKGRLFVTTTSKSFFKPCPKRIL